MKRILVVDDEQPVVDHLVRIVERELADAFTVVGTASSGRETLEKVASLQPDIIVLDVRMPGLSGLDTIRELRRRGSLAAFILSTAYERFDIAREALELGISGYLLKPVTKDALGQALKTASDQLDRRAEEKRREFDGQEKDVQLRGYVVEAYLTGLMLGRNDLGMRGLREWIGIDKPWGLIAVAAFVHSAQEGRKALDLVLQYKSRAFCGPMASGRCLIFQALGSASEAEEAEAQLVATLRAAPGEHLQPENLRLGFARPRLVEELAQAWPEALIRLSGKTPAASARFASGGTFEEEEEFQTALMEGDQDRVRYCFEALLVPFEAGNPSLSDRYRIVALLGWALGRLVALGYLEESVAHHGMDFDDLRQAADGQEFCLLARSRLPAITGALSRAQRWSVWVSRAMEYIRVNFGQPLTLDLVAERAGISAKRLSRLFVDELGQGFSEYLIDYRIEKAKVMLSLPGVSIKQVSKECGYSDPNYFARLFKKVTGKTPSDFSSVP